MKRNFDKPKEKHSKEDDVRTCYKLKENKPLKCWLCEDDHMVNNCPSKPNIATVTQSKGKKKEEPVVGMMQILGVVTTMEVVPKRDPQRNKLEYVDMKIRQGTFLTKVDSGATHNFVREEATTKVGLKFAPTQACLKVMNSPPDQVIGIAENVEVKIGEWIGKVDFTGCLNG